MNTIDTLKKTIKLIETNLESQDLNITFLSNKVFVSSFYLQRMFYSIIGKTIGAYIRERRLTEAGTDIKNGEKVINVAIKYGYVSKESFTRAFKKFHGINPGTAKKGVTISCLLPINVNSLEKGVINIAEHLWGKFYTKGRMPNTIQNLWKEVIDWVQNSEYEIAANYDFECYSEGVVNSDDYVSGILVPLKLK